MDRAEIERILPHRPPFLLLDQVTELVPGERAVGIKHVRDDEYWVPAHFPGDPVMPGVLVAEALAQTAAVVALAGHEDSAPVYLVGMDKLRFRKPVRPGDTLVLEAECAGRRRGFWTFLATATVDGARVADGKLLATAAP